MVDKKENTSINESIIYARKELLIAFRFLCVYAYNNVVYYDCHAWKHFIKPPF